MKVGRYNYAAQFPGGIGKVASQLEQMLRDGHYVLSPQVAEFEAAFAGFLQSHHARGVNTGTDALAIAFSALGIGPGDEVITQANTFNATVSAILMVGANPVLVDADERTFLMDVSQLTEAVTARTRAVVPVHLFGKPTPMQPLLELSAERGIAVVEDAAQAHGAKWNGRHAGTIGIAGCFSFHPSKNLAAAGDGGAIVTDDESIAQAIDEIRSLGQRGQNSHVRPGLNSKLDALQAVVLSAKLPYLDEWNAQRRRVAGLYREKLRGLPLRFQAESVDEEHVYHLFQIRTVERDRLLRHLISAGVDAVVRYPQPIHLQPAFGRWNWRPGQFPVAEALCRELLCLPIRPDLTEDDVDYVADRVKDFFAAQ